MGDSYGDPQKGRNFNNGRDGIRGGFRNGRNPGGRDSGGFRIRLSDNEMRASRTIQEAFNLRSTVAVLGFALRTLGQMIEEGKIDELIAEYRSQNPQSKQNKFNSERDRGRTDNQSSHHSKPNPFARPAKPEQKSNEDNQEKESENNLNNESSENKSIEPIETKEEISNDEKELLNNQ
ncbi:hypothetical protein [Prochlorococcus marinus]|uniref:hypothetical protein n=1 Tax=Prochlorococcus marinus TaxID=1219 RepID=UPI0022B4D022|nr:hypothetical protein [Prochlorococcus marinus]